MVVGGEWQRLADYVLERRLELDMTQADVHAAGGPSTAVIRQVEGALSDSYTPVILSRLERALGWERGSVRAIRAGGEPVPVPRGEAGDPPSVRRILSDPELPYGARMELAALARDLIKRYAGGGQRIA
jgi:hypothetical protein